MRKFAVLLTFCALALQPLAAQARPRARAAYRGEDSSGVRLPEFIQPPATQQSLLLDLSESGYGGIGAIYDRALGMANSINVGLAGSGSGTSNNYWTSVEVKVGYSWWIQKDFWPHPRRPLLGWFVGPVLKLDNVNWHLDWGNGNANYNGTYFGGGAQGGYQWVFHPGLTARVFADAGFLGGGLSNQYGYSPGFGGPYVGGHAAVGWSF